MTQDIIPTHALRAETQQMQKLLLVAVMLFCGIAAAQTSNQNRVATFPGATWAKSTPEQLGWARTKLDETRKFFDTFPPASLFVVDHGNVVVEWGDSAMKIKISSMRKSLLSALCGIYAGKGGLDLDKTIGQLGIDDDPPLTQQEKQATVRMLLQARSGIYHSYVAGTPAMRENMPSRGSHAPGTFWFYNNWDFNALGTIFEQELHLQIGDTFRDGIAGPIQMQDFRLQDMYYLRSRPDSPDYERSRHPAYHFRMTARDLARFGYLMLRGGNWNGTQIIPSSWVEESTRSYSDADGAGYGYLWWVNGFGLPVRSFSAQGALAKYVVVIPDRELVVVYLNHAEFPDNASALPAVELKALPTISKSQISHLLQLLVEAQQRPDSAGKE
jgi:CubicO group peptidase (beta-lactamase class C family)